MKVAITGSHGLVARHLIPALEGADTRFAPWSAANRGPERSAGTRRRVIWTRRLSRSTQ